MDVTTSLLMIGTLLLLVASLFALMFSYYYVLQHMTKKFPELYQTLNSPFIPTANHTLFQTIRRDRYNYQILGNLLSGYPANFPDDKHLQRLAKQVQIEILLSTSLIGTSLGIFLAII